MVFLGVFYGLQRAELETETLGSFFTPCMRRNVMRSSFSMTRFMSNKKIWVYNKCLVFDDCDCRLDVGNHDGSIRLRCCLMLSIHLHGQARTPSCSVPMQLGYIPSIRPFIAFVIGWVNHPRRYLMLDIPYLSHMPYISTKLIEVHVMLEAGHHINCLSIPCIFNYQRKKALSGLFKSLENCQKTKPPYVYPAVAWRGPRSTTTLRLISAFILELIDIGLVKACSCLWEIWNWLITIVTCSINVGRLEWWSISLT